ncbi:hypothetical protein HUG10_19925 (plasmid) [Halorarum halophilum]|uniref:Uncharacterized protein n=1 Tax=Halorarum halophilum TaxID=2743090 RepID=A0A7D5K3T7_9EURY|nr:hypothetical protein HUG10_19925 [Halobaculum halophilum]
MQLYQRGFTHIKDLRLADVHELDFVSMYPNIIRENNVSPETVRCGCCGEDNARDIVPEFGYTICQEEGYLGDILGPLIDDRDAMKWPCRGPTTRRNERGLRRARRPSSGFSSRVSTTRATGSSTPSGSRQPPTSPIETVGRLWRSPPRPAACLEASRGVPTGDAHGLRAPADEAPGGTACSWTDD